MKEKRRLWTINQLDAIGVRGPHQKELEDISNAKYPIFRDLEIEKLKDIVVNDIGGTMSKIGLGEEWTFTFKMFPEVNTHISYSWFGDEFGDGKEAELKYYFSGKRVHLVPGEDIVTVVDILMDFIERMVKNEEPFDKSYDKKSKMMKKVLIQRREVFKFLKDEDKEKLSTFIGAKVWKTSNAWRITREMFPNVFVEVIWRDQKDLDIAFSGEDLDKKISSTHLELIGSLIINHILRYITLNNLEKNLPEICFMMFSRYFSKQKNWVHRS